MLTSPPARSLLASGAPAVGLSCLGSARRRSQAALLLRPLPSPRRRSCVAVASLPVGEEGWAEAPQSLSALTFYSCVPPGLADTLGIKVRNLGTPPHPTHTHRLTPGLAAMMVLIREVLHNLREHRCEPVPRCLPSPPLWAPLVRLTVLFPRPPPIPTPRSRL